MSWPNTFAHVSAVVALDVSDYYQVGRGMRFRFLEKGGRQHEMPALHVLVEFMDTYLEVLDAGDAPLLRSTNRQRTGFTPCHLDHRGTLAMVKRRLWQAGLGDRSSNHSLRATVFTAYLRNGG